MSLDVDKSKEATGGFSVSDRDGLTTGFYTSGQASPIGNACPTPTIYLDGNYNVWTNTGPGPNDWIQLGSASGSSDNCLDGGFANSVYTPEQCFDGGGA